MEYDFVSFDYSKNLNIIFVQTIIIYVIPEVNITLPLL